LLPKILVKCKNRFAFTYTNSSPLFGSNSRVARWHIFKPKIPILVTFGRS
jgi:hypothetical protein